MAVLITASSYHFQLTVISHQILRQDYEEKDWVQYQIHVHGLKNVSANIGAMELSGQFKGLEYAIKNHDIPDTVYIRSHHDKVMEAYQELLRRLERDI